MYWNLTNLLDLLNRIWIQKFSMFLGAGASVESGGNIGRRAYLGMEARYIYLKNPVLAETQ